MSFSDFGLDHRLLKRLQLDKLTEPTPVQAQTIPYIMQGRDLAAGAKTGSGKTFAFLLPAIHRLLNTKPLSRKDARLLILAPTRELAKQVFMVAKNSVQNLPLQVALVVGGENYNDQCKILRRHPHIIVGTPGRVADHLADRSIFLNGLEMLVLDEADRMLELGFSEQLSQINQQADHRKRQTVMFSATLDGADIQTKIAEQLKNPKVIILDKAFDKHMDIDEQWFYVDHLDHKIALLQHIIANERYQHQQAIIFCANKDQTEKLAELLNSPQTPSAALHSDKSQSERNQVLQQIRSNQLQYLFTTDIASRGLDIKRLELVINFDLPLRAEEYVHRIGRTGRAGAQGQAISFVGPKDWRSAVNLQRNSDANVTISNHPELPAKFSGYEMKSLKVSPVPQIEEAKQAKTEVKKKVQKRLNISLTDVGNIKIKRKPRKQINSVEEQDIED